MSWVPCSVLGYRDRGGQNASVEQQNTRDVPVMGAAGADKVEEDQEDESVLAEGRALALLGLGEICFWGVGTEQRPEARHQAWSWGECLKLRTV